jgi:hypothetical protein
MLAIAKKTFGFVIALVALLTIVYGIYSGIALLLRLFTTLQKEVAVAIIAAMGTVLVSVFSLLAGKFIERKRVIDAEIRVKKIPMYESFVEFWMKVLQKSDDQTAEDKDRFVQSFFVTFTQAVMVWGSDDVIVKWSRLRRKFVQANEGDFDPTLFLEFERLLLAIRRDTGHQNGSPNTRVGVISGRRALARAAAGSSRGRAS